MGQLEAVEVDSLRENLIRRELVGAALDDLRGTLAGIIPDDQLVNMSEQECLELRSQLFYEPANTFFDSFYTDAILTNDVSGQVLRGLIKEALVSIKLQDGKNHNLNLVGFVLTLDNGMKLSEVYESGKPFMVEIAGDFTVNFPSSNIYFIRHNANKLEEKPRYEDVKNKKRIAICFDNKPWNTVFNSIKQEPSANCTGRNYRSAIRLFHKLSTEGGYVIVEYLGGDLGKNAAGNDEFGAYVSRVLPGTPVEATPDFNVTLKLDEYCYHKFLYSDYPVLLAIRPPFLTVCEPSTRTYGWFVDHILTGRLPSPSVNLLHPKMAEQMCDEYLRMHGVDGKKMDYCTLRPGKSLAVIDICGVLDNDKNVFAQVKNGKIDTGDLQRFIDFARGNNAINIVFSTDSQLPFSSPNVTHINIEDVFKKLSISNSKMLKKMIGF